ncbi:hypothetical protein F5Y17DRAFT_176183 [Xylariaceae sp. FL0594]|nr:hypothetical protein F5Y17DRAFT_176183 [Xylariaceae sp. FL0594]
MYSLYVPETTERGQFRSTHKLVLSWLFVLLISRLDTGEGDATYLRGWAVGDYLLSTTALLVPVNLYLTAGRVCVECVLIDWLG